MNKNLNLLAFAAITLFTSTQAAFAEKVAMRISGKAAAQLAEEICETLERENQDLGCNDRIVMDMKAKSFTASLTQSKTNDYGNTKGSIYFAKIVLEHGRSMESPHRDLYEMMLPLFTANRAVKTVETTMKSPSGAQKVIAKMTVLEGSDITCVRATSECTFYGKR